MEEWPNSRTADSHSAALHVAPDHTSGGNLFLTTGLNVLMVQAHLFIGVRETYLSKHHKVHFAH